MAVEPRKVSGSGAAVWIAILAVSVLVRLAGGLSSDVRGDRPQRPAEPRPVQPPGPPPGPAFAQHVPYSAPAARPAGAPAEERWVVLRRAPK